MQGREPATEIPKSENKANNLSELTTEDREWLRRLINEPGFSVLLRLLNRTILKREEGAKLLSSNDPFGDKDRIIKEWAYIACFKAVLLEVRILVQDAQNPPMSNTTDF
jgi:hypothetical protein